VPYGVYDLAANAGWVSVGVDHDTAAFAVNSIRQWWLNLGRPRYPNATRLLITADGGGSNGSRVRLDLPRAGTRRRAASQISRFGMSNGFALSTEVTALVGLSIGIGRAVKHAPRIHDQAGLGLRAVMVPRSRMLKRNPLSDGQLIRVGPRALIEPFCRCVRDTRRLRPLTFLAAS
jgi:hypothetical protein